MASTSIFDNTTALVGHARPQELTLFRATNHATQENRRGAERMFSVGDLDWAAVERDFRLLAINSALRRQHESMRAAVMLCERDLGHLPVSFVRASLEDVMYLKFFVSLDVESSQELFMLLGSWDSLRSLLAQRAFIGDETMKKLWYSIDFLEQVEHQREQVKAKLNTLKRRYRGSSQLRV